MLSIKYVGLFKHKRLYSTFQSLGISENIVNNLKTQFSINQPTKSQTQFIPHILSGKDMILRDSTGTGKSFGIALALSSDPLNPSLYITPNQELTNQMKYWIQQLTTTDPNNNINNNNTLSNHIIVDTPAHLLQQLNENKDYLKGIQRIVIDEVDQALRLPKRYAPLKQQKLRQSHPKPTQLLLESLLQLHHENKIKKPQLIASSATLNRPLRYWMTQEGWMTDPIFIDITHGHYMPSARITTDNNNNDNNHDLNKTPIPIDHHCLLIDNDSIRNIKSLEDDINENNIHNDNDTNNNKKKKSKSSSKVLDFNDIDDRMIDSLSILHELEKPSMNNSVLFVDSSVSMNTIQDKLSSNSILAKDIKEAINHQQPQCKDNNEKKILWIATEFTARGIDLPNISHVFILGNPSSISSYLHMAGRTGRLGQASGGKVISLIRDHGKMEFKMLNMYKLMNVPVKPLEHVE
ncbi:unnamed protein product [Cunninghamella blakesleeana]